MKEYKTIGDALINELSTDEYFHSQYQTVLSSYSAKMLKCGVACSDASPVDIGALLFYADLLSKSSDQENAELHHLWAQEIIILLHELYPGNKTIDYYMGAILSEVGNFVGLGHSLPDYRDYDFLEEARRTTVKEYLRIPASDQGSFLFAQKSIYSHFDSSYFSYSAPTSLGKSFIMRMFIKEQISKKENLNFAVVVPSKALINEVNSKLTEELKDLLDEADYRIVNTAGATTMEEKHNFIFVMTPERLLYLLILRPEVNIDYMFIDEAHKISKKDSRSTFYYQIVGILSERHHKPHFIFASPNIPNPEIYLHLVHGSTDLENNMIATQYSPVCQEKFLIDFNDGKTYFYNEHSEELCYSGLLPCESSLSAVLSEYGQGKRNIVYSDSPEKVVTYARSFAENLAPLNDPELEQTAEQIRKEVHEKYYLAELITKGVAYHMGYLPSSIRLRIEELFKGKIDESGTYHEGKIHTLFCTSTLLEGVNLPADNLFITSYRNGRKMTAIEFKNLMGRVGRIEFNLYGNVFLLCIKSVSTKKNYQELLKTKIEPQRLSISSALSPEQKKLIADSLKAGIFELPRPEGMSEEDYGLLRKFSNILLRDIVKRRNSYLVKEFSDFISKEEKENIIQNFGSRSKELDEDINTSPDQNELLYMAIHKGMKYPAIQPGLSPDYNVAYDFLTKLAEVFKWRKYESSTLGYTNAAGELSKLRRYTFVMIKWMEGKSFKEIVDGSLQYYRIQDQEGINQEIANLLEIIENILQFRLTNYFMKFTKAYRDVNPDDDNFQDWYEFIEYGTTSKLSIWLQRNSFSRDVARYISGHQRRYLRFYENEKILMNEALLRCPRPEVQKEALQVFYNNKKLFNADEKL